MLGSGPDSGALHDHSDSGTPEEVFSALLAAAIHWYERGQISQEKAAQVAGLDRTDFLALAREGVDVFVVDFNDLQSELERA